MSLFSGIHEAKSSPASNYIIPGNYALEVTRCKNDRTRKGDDYFLAEFRVLESDVATRPVGSTASFMVMYKHDSALGNIKPFMAAACECDEDEVDEKLANAIVGPENPIVGNKLRARAVNVLTKKGTDFTKVEWFEYK